MRVFWLTNSLYILKSSFYGRVISLSPMIWFGVINMLVTFSHIMHSHCGGCTVSPFHMTFTAHMVANFHFFIWHLPIMPLFYPLFFLLNFSFLSLFPCCVDSKAITLDLKVTRGYLGVRGWVLIKWFDSNSNQEVPLIMVNGNCGWWYWMLLQPVGKPLNQRSSKLCSRCLRTFWPFKSGWGHWWWWWF